MADLTLIRCPRCDHPNFQLSLETEPYAHRGDDRYRWFATCDSCHHEYELLPIGSLLLVRTPSFEDSPRPV